MKRIEISKPTKWWWVKRMDIYVAIILVFLPLYISMEYQDLGKSIFQSVTSGLIWVAPISLYFLLFSVSRRLNYPYVVNIMDDSIEVVYLSPGKEKKKAYTYETIDIFQQGKGKRDRITFARKGAFLPTGPCLNQYNGWSAEKRAEVIEALTENGIKVRHP
jgi:hypothetical protein